jgi:hypothetical protein
VPSQSFCAEPGGGSVNSLERVLQNLVTNIALVLVVRENSLLAWTPRTLLVASLTDGCDHPRPAITDIVLQKQFERGMSAGAIE